MNRIQFYPGRANIRGSPPWESAAPRSRSAPAGSRSRFRWRSSRYP